MINLNIDNLEHILKQEIEEKTKVKMQLEEIFNNNQMIIGTLQDEIKYKQKIKMENKKSRRM